MDYKVLVDSCGEFTQEMKESEVFHSIPLYITVGDHQIIDDETFDQADYLKRAAAEKECPRSACPSPEQYLNEYKGSEKRVYIVTLSENLSGSYNSAYLAKQMYDEKYGDKQMYVFNSKSASVGETLIALKIQECETAGMEFDQVVEAVELYITEQNTFFVLEDLDTLHKNGRLSGLKMLVASALKIKPILGATPEGTICQLTNARGMKKAVSTLAAEVVKGTRDSAGKILAISHCNCKERALHVRDLILQHMKVKDVIIVDTRGISSMYASDGGVIVVI